MYAAPWSWLWWLIKWNMSIIFHYFYICIIYFLFMWNRPSVYQEVAMKPRDFVARFMDCWDSSILLFSLSVDIHYADNVFSIAWLGLCGTNACHDCRQISSLGCHYLERSVTSMTARSWMATFIWIFVQSLLNANYYCNCVLPAASFHIIFHSAIGKGDGRYIHCT